MGACGRRVKSIVKGVARELTPVGVALIGDIVGITAETDWTNDEKRENAVALAKSALRQRGIEARESAIRAGVEGAVTALKDGQEALAELGQMDDDDQAEVATD